MGEFKGTKGVAHNDGINIYIGTRRIGNSLLMTYDVNKRGILIPDTESEENAKNWSDSHNVRQQIDCSLTELLEQRNELAKMLKNNIGEKPLPPEAVGSNFTSKRDYDIANLKWSKAKQLLNKIK